MNEDGIVLQQETPSATPGWEPDRRSSAPVPQWWPMGGSPGAAQGSRPFEARPGAGPADSSLGSRRSLVHTLLSRIERFFVPDQMLADGNVDERAVQRRYRRMVGVVSGASVVAFVPTMVVAGVPPELWPEFVAGVIVTACVISASLLLVRAHTVAAILAALITALTISGLDRIIGAYYHQLPLLFALVVSGFAIIQGFRAALVMVISGGFLVPLASSGGRGLNATDPVFAFVYLLGLTAIIWTYVRLTDRGVAAVQASEAKYRELVERVPAVVYAADFGPMGAWRYVSPRVEQLLGFPAEAWTGDPGFWWNHVHPDDRDRVLAEEIETWEGPTAQPGGIEYRMLNRDGQVRWVLDDATVVPSSDGSTLQWSGFLTDITEHKELEARFQEAQKMEAVGRLAGGVAHDFNNLLTAISGFAELVEGDLAPDDPHRSDIDQILAASRRAASLTRQLLAFGRRQILQPRVLDLNDVVHDIVPLLRRLIGEDIELVVHPDSDLERTLADPGQLAQVILNLAVNARDAMPGGGTLTIATSNVTLDSAHGRDHAEVPPGPYVLLSVTDTGVGMDAETMDHLFEPFFTTKERGKGTGLGLATVFGIVRQSSGHVLVSSEVGRGSTFRVFLPRATEHPATDEPDAARPPVRGGSESILVVEDEPAVRAFAAEVLERHGYRVIAAADGQEALRLAGQPATRVDLLFTDLVMPGLSGRDVAGRLGAERPGLRVLYASGYAEGASIPPDMLGSGRAYLTKPYGAAALAGKVREILDSR